MNKQLFGGDWTATKLDIIKKYLASYTRALKNQHFRLQYIDAFAGAGYCGKQYDFQDYGLFAELAEPEAQGFLKGSPRVAL